MAQKTTLSDLAAKAGVHRSTVSLALRDHPRISKEVREHIQALARKMGYRINPLVAALMQSRRTGSEPKHLVLAYVTNYPTRFGWRPPHHDRPDFFPGATARAKELGYKLEHFWLGEPGMTPQRFSDILTSRGINGLLIGRLPPGCDTLDLRWDRFSAVALGLTLRNPALHHVAEDPFSGATLAMEECLARGYRRPGFVFSQADDSPNTGDRYLGAFLRQQQRLPEKDRIPPCLYYAPPGFEAPFSDWLKQYKPDVLIATHAHSIADMLAKLRLRTPEDIGLMSLINDHPELGFSGIYHDPARLGSLAVDMLTGMLHRGETGIPADPHIVQSTGLWMEGRTIRARA